MATAIVGYLLDINPFDQPDVEAAKQRTREILSGSGRARCRFGVRPARRTRTAEVRRAAGVLSRRRTTRGATAAVAARLRDKFHVAVTVGFGPRFLHSTGQLHKGGPNSGVFVQITSPHTTDVVIPTMDMSFGKLIDAQADGDLQALRDAGRPAARVTLDALEGLVSG